MSIAIQADGRRLYITGNTFPLKDSIRDIGGKWDAARKAWWVASAKRADIEALIGSTAAESAPAVSPERKAPGESATVAGRASYKGKSYYVAGRKVRGRTQWDDSVAAVTSRDGSKVLLYSRDGSLEFWAPLQQFGARIIVGAPTPEGVVVVEKIYDRPQSIGGLRKFAERAKSEHGAHGEGRCRDCGTRIESWMDGASAGLCHDCA